MIVGIPLLTVIFPDRNAKVDVTENKASTGR